MGGAGTTAGVDGVGIQEGCINHALLTAQAIAKTGYRSLAGWLTESIQDWRISGNH